MRPWGRSTSRRVEAAALPPWWRPFPTGPVQFDPSLRRADGLGDRRAGRLDGAAPLRPAGPGGPPRSREASVVATKATIATKLSVPLLEDLPDPTGRAVLVHATLDRPLAGDPAEPLATHRARCLADTVGMLLGHGARVTVCGDLDGGSAQREQTLAAVQALLRPAAARPGQAVAVNAVSEDDASVAELVAARSTSCGSPETDRRS